MAEPKYNVTHTPAQQHMQTHVLKDRPAARVVDRVSEKPWKVQEDVLYIAEQCPQMMSTFYPRVYEAIGQYHSPKLLAAFLTHMVVSAEHMGMDSSYTPTAYKLMMPAARYLQEKRMPTLFLAPDFLKAVLATDFKDEIDWTTAALPYEHGVLVLPKGNPLQSAEGEAGYIFWSRVRAGDYKPPLYSKLPTLQLETTSFCMTALCPSNGTWYDSNLSARYKSTLKLRNMYCSEPGVPMPDLTQDSVWDAPLAQDEAEFLETLGTVLWGTFLALNARPDLLTRAHVEKIVQAKSDKPRREFWSPNVVGRNYRIQREKGTGTHASPRMHFRRGHFRSQPYGVGRAERRTIWLEPCLIAAPKGEAT